MTFPFFKKKKNGAPAPVAAPQAPEPLGLDDILEDPELHAAFDHFCRNVEFMEENLEFYIEATPPYLQRLTQLSQRYIQNGPNNIAINISGVLRAEILAEIARIQGLGLRQRVDYTVLNEKINEARNECYDMLVFGPLTRFKQTEAFKQIMEGRERQARRGRRRFFRF